MIKVYPSGGAAMSACEAITPPAPGRFSTTTDWPHCLETASPRVRVSTSTAPPAAYGTKICTGLVGNDWASAAEAIVAMTAATNAAIRNQLVMAPLPLLSLLLYGTWPFGP